MYPAFLLLHVLDFLIRRMQVTFDIKIVNSILHLTTHCPYLSTVQDFPSITFVSPRWVRGLTATKNLLYRREYFFRKRMFPELETKNHVFYGTSIFITLFIITCRFHLPHRPEWNAHFPIVFLQVHLILYSHVHQVFQAPFSFSI